MTEIPPSSRNISRFVASLPTSYREKYASAAVTRHAAIASQRGSNPVAVGLLSDDHPGGAGLCVIAADQPGLLATISGALILLGLDVVDAEAYTRKLDSGRFEAVDLFWVRRQGSSSNGASPPDEADALKLQETLTDILLGRRRFPTIPPMSSSDALPLHQTDTRVRFIADSAGGLGTLEVETGDRSGLLWGLSRALFEHKVQIINSEVRTRDGRVFDRFVIVELDGAPINESRRLEIQVAVLGAIEPARRKSAQPGAEA